MNRPKIGLVLAWLVIGVALLWAVVPALFTGYDPIAGVPAEKLQPPSGQHLFGTDAMGRDLFARVVHGAVHSLSGAFVAVGVGLLARHPARPARRARPAACSTTRSCGSSTCCCRSPDCSWR